MTLRSWPFERSPFPDGVGFAAIAEDGPDLPVLLPEEASLLSDKAVASRRRQFALGRAAARRALAQLGGASSPILRGDQRQPLFPDGFAGSITHSGGWAAAAVARHDQYGGIGLDICQLVDFAELVPHVAHGAETEWLANLDGEDRDRGAVALFSAKESIYKAFFPRVGHFFGFDAVRLTKREPAGGFAASFVEPLDPDYPPGRRFGVTVEWSENLVLTTVLLQPS